MVKYYCDICGTEMPTSQGNLINHSVKLNVHFRYGHETDYSIELCEEHYGKVKEVLEYKGFFVDALSKLCFKEL